MSQGVVHSIRKGLRNTLAHRTEGASLTVQIEMENAVRNGDTYVS